MYEIIETPKMIFIVMEYALGGEYFDYVMEEKMYLFTHLAKINPKPSITSLKSLQHSSTSTNSKSATETSNPKTCSSIP
jgi:hypothetical protein